MTAQVASLVAPALQQAVTHGLSKSGAVAALGRFGLKEATLTALVTTLVIDKLPSLLSSMWSGVTWVFKGRKEKKVAKKQETEALQIAKRHETELAQLRQQMTALERKQHAPAVSKPRVQSVKPASGSLKI